MIRRLFRRAFPRSRGVRVTGATHRRIRAGDAARGRGAWREAAAAYRAALAAMPGLQHIWVQLGHAEKEAGAAAAAAAAYARAAALDPLDPEPHLHLGHLVKRRDATAAARHFLDALRRDPDGLSAAGETMQLLVGHRIDDARMIDEALRLLRIDRASLAVSRRADQPATATVFLDVSDLIAFLGHSRIPSGIQRTQVEIVLALLASGRRDVAICHYAAGRRGWTIIAAADFETLCAAARGTDEAHWETTLRRLHAAAMLSDTLAFPAGSALVYFGAGAHGATYLLDVRTEGAASGLAYVPVIYDLIPILFPQFMVTALARDFAAAFAAMLHTARGFVAISEATRRDALAVARRWDAPFADGVGRVVRLDGDAIRHDVPPAPPGRLERLGLRSGGFVLFVSTIEPRKNHVGAFRAWLTLADEIGLDTLPALVCVGGRGWLNDAVHAMLAREPVLRSKVRMLSGIADDDLALLYRECLCTLYPSLYEGWGLPVTESLCHGKVPVVADNSSLPEAGGPFAAYFDAGDTGSMTAAVRPLILDPAYRAAREADIAARFRPRSWATIGAELVDAARAIAATTDRGPPTAPADRAIAFGHGAIAAGAVDAERYRIGHGWGTADEGGCPITGTDARLAFARPAGASLLAVALAAGDRGADYRVGDVAGRLVAGGRATVTVTLPNAATAEIAIAATAPLIVEGFRLSA